MNLTNRITGLEDVLKVFRKLPKSMQSKAYRASLKEGAEIIKNMASENVKAIATKGYATGTLEKNIRSYSGRKYRGNFRALVQVRRKAVNSKKLVNGQPVRLGLYASVLEYGKRGHAPQSWIRKAIREGEGQAFNAIRSGISKRMFEVLRDAKR
jgi:HK97 gp10 family phage protein